MAGDSPERREDGIYNYIATGEDCDKVGKEDRD